MGSFLKKAGLATATGGLSLLFGGGGDSSAPQIDPQVAANAGKMSTIANSQYDWAKATNDKLAPTFDHLTGVASGVADNGVARGDALWQSYSDTFAPVTTQVGADAMGWDSAPNLEHAATEAASTVGKSYAQAANRRGATMAKYGINPTDALHLGEGANLQQAADEAVAANNARDLRRNQAVQMRTNAAGLGLNLAAGANSSDQLALAGGGTGANIAATGVNTHTAAVDSALPWYTGSNNALLGINQQQTQQYNTQQQANSAQMAGLGSLVGTIGGAVIGGPIGASIGGKVGGAVATKAPSAAGSPFAFPFPTA